MTFFRTMLTEEYPSDFSFLSRLFPQDDADGSIDFNPDSEEDFAEIDPFVEEIFFDDTPPAFSFTPDPSGLPRLLAQETPDTITLFEGDLAGYSDGIWTLGGDDVVFASFESERILLNRGNDTVYGGGGDDEVFGGQQDDRIFGEDGNDFLRGDRDGDMIEGGEGDDRLFGGKGNDQLFGNDGEDILSGDLGIDSLTGGGDRDIFILRTDEASFDLNQVDVITDFDWFESGDKIALTDGLTEADIDYTRFADYEGDGVANDTLITLRTTDEILGVVLNADDFALFGQFVSVDTLALV